MAHWARMKIAPEAWPYSEDLGFDLRRSFTGDLSRRPAVHRAFMEDAPLTLGELPYQDREAELAGADGMRGKGPVVYRENFGVPLIIRHPDVQGGTQSSARVSTC